MTQHGLQMAIPARLRLVSTHEAVGRPRLGPFVSNDVQDVPSSLLCTTHDIRLQAVNVCTCISCQ